MTFGEFLRELRGNRNMTLRRLGEAAGMDYVALNKIELGYLSPPRLEGIIALADALSKVEPLSADDTQKLLDLAAQPTAHGKSSRYTEAEVERIKESPTGRMFFRTARGKRG